jgi:S-DNA-T family DNA segregation ATPase FtsK/SpoIIIE
VITAQLRRELVAIALILFAVFLLGATLSAALFSAADVPCHLNAGWFGPVGNCLSEGLFASLGVPTAVLLSLVPALFALRLFGRLHDSSVVRSWPLFAAGAVLLLPIVLALVSGAPRDVTPGSGLWGAFAAWSLVGVLGTAGAWVFVVLAVSALTAATLAWNPIRMIIGSGAAARSSRAASAEKVRPPDVVIPPAAAEGDMRLTRRKSPLSDLNPTDDPDAASIGADAVAGSSSTSRRSAAKGRSRAPAGTSGASGTPFPAGPDLALDGAVLLPPIELLTPAPPKHADVGKRELDAMGEKLMDALRTFRVEGELVGRTTGPVVTQFEVAPAAGVKVRQIANLANDLALAMRAASIRIVAPIPGRGAVGVEVPNPTSEIVSFRELLESREFQASRGVLPIALGKDLEGRAVIADLAKMPHLLIAGATGSGKSVCINTVITSLIYRHTPATLRLIMVDPKMVELSSYNVLPHLRHKVVTDNRDAAASLKWAVIEMQDRYELLAANGARNIQEFNKRVEEGLPLRNPRNPDLAFEELTYRGGVLPYIVVVIDELADLMMTVQGEIETPLAKIAQKARAIGIHLILATQRPSVNVITGLIKANFPSRIAFRVASQVDSRTIIDGVGAESLLGNGDMLFIPPGKSEPARLQGAFIPSEDTERLTNWYVEMRERRRAAFEARGLLLPDVATGEPDILETVRVREAAEAAAHDGEGEGQESGERDRLFREAAEIVIQHQQGSTSLLQRRLKVGYGRAARIIDQLHLAGVLGPPDGSRPRDVLIGLADLDRVCGPRV